MHSVTIDARFCGPPESGNGGYCCGLLANGIDGPAEVTLLAPPPLGVPLTLEKRDGEIFLCDGTTDIGRARATTLTIDPPPPPSAAQSKQAARRYQGFTGHIFPRCFVCGPERTRGDGLRIFAGPTSDGAMVASPWQPDDSLADKKGVVRNEFVWAALDCPSYFGLQIVGLPALLGRMQAQILSRPKAGAHCVVTGWYVSHTGRKYLAGSALYNMDGTLLARASTLWIRLRDVV